MDIFEQVDEDVRRQRTLEWFKRYGWPLGLIAGALVAIVVGWRGWQTFQNTQQEQASDRFLEMIISGDPMEMMVQDGDRLAALNLFYEATQDPDRAGEIYDRLATQAPPVWRDLARIFHLYSDFEQLDDATIRAHLVPFDTPFHPWRSLAWDLLAANALRNQDSSGARAYLMQIINDEASPPTLRQRSENIITTLEP